MHHAFMRIQKLRPTAGPVGEPPVLALNITDMGGQDGIDVSIRDEASDQIYFETVLADPDSRILLTVGSPETVSAHPQKCWSHSASVLNSTVSLQPFDGCHIYKAHHSCGSSQCRISAVGRKSAG